MPATTNKKTSSATPSPKKAATGTSDTSSLSPSGAGWSAEQKAQLFAHVCAVGETDWVNAVPGKSGPQSRKHWKNVLCPSIKRQQGWE